MWVNFPYHPNFVRPLPNSAAIQKNGNEIILGFAQYYARRHLDISQFPNLRLVSKETEVQV